MVVVDPKNETSLEALFPPQQEIIDSGLLSSGFNVVLQMPTGSGKTWLAEQAIAETLRTGGRALYITPLRALATELASRWRQRFTDCPVGVFTGDYGRPGRPFPVSFRDAQLMVMTPERLDACTRAWRSHWDWIPEVDLMVVDEVHLLGDNHRGARLEGAVSRMRRLNPFLRIIALSATLGNRTQLADWLDGVEYVSTWRPIRTEWSVLRYQKADQKPELLKEAVSTNIAQGGKSLVFVQSRRSAEWLCRFLSEQGFRSKHHHAGLNVRARGEIEASFRSGEVDILVATATLEMGLNMPVRQVVLYDLQCFDGTDFVPLSCVSVWQRAGRAGRVGLDTKGEVVLISARWDKGAERYADGQFEEVRSRLAEPRNLTEQIIAEVASGLSRTQSQLVRSLSQSLAAFQSKMPSVGETVLRMLQAGMLANTEDNPDSCARAGLKATRLGRIASRHMLQPDSILLFDRVLKEQDALTFFDLLLLATSSNDCEPVLPADFEELDQLAGVIGAEASFILRQHESEVTQLLGVGGKRLLAALKTAVVARQWTRDGSSESVAEENGCYPFEVERLCESLERLFLAMSAVRPKPIDEQDEELVTPEEIPVYERIQVLQKMISSGLDECAVTLTLIPGVGPTIAKKLVGHGTEDIETLALAEIEEIASIPGISRKRAERWVDAASELISTRSAYAYREFGPTANLTPTGWPADTDPYRLRRALDLKVTADGPCYRVSGGLEPHTIRREKNLLHCDCPDADKGNTCKHVLAVRLARKDKQLLKLARQVKETNNGDGQLDLFRLWFNGQSPRSRGNNHVR